MTELDEVTALRDRLKETIRRSEERAAAERPDAFSSEADKRERLRLLAGMEATLLKLRRS